MGWHEVLVTAAVVVLWLTVGVGWRRRKGRPGWRPTQAEFKITVPPPTG